MKGKSLSGIRLKKKLFPISTIIALLCLTPLYVMWTSAQTPPTLNLTFNVAGEFRGKGNCLQAQSGTIQADLPHGPYPFEVDSVDKNIGGLRMEARFSYDAALPLPLDLVTDIMVHIHVDGSFRRLNEGVPAELTLLMISGCTAAPETAGVQYCISAYSEAENIGTVTKTGSNTWLVEAFIPLTEQGSSCLCVNQWSDGSVEDGFCISLSGFQVEVSGTITT
jgi:hypothetical protein